MYEIPNHDTQLDAPYQRQFDGVVDRTPDDPTTCVWSMTPDPNCEIWESDCGVTWQFETGGPEENSMRFCCGCGKPLIAQVEEVIDDDDLRADDPGQPEPWEDGDND